MSAEADYDKMTVAQLREALKKKGTCFLQMARTFHSFCKEKQTGLSTSGLKSELVARLKNPNAKEDEEKKKQTGTDKKDGKIDDHKEDKKEEKKIEMVNDQDEKKTETTNKSSDTKEEEEQTSKKGGN